jgi:hypothetical protein
MPEAPQNTRQTEKKGRTFTFVVGCGTTELTYPRVCSISAQTLDDPSTPTAVENKAYLKCTERPPVSLLCRTANRSSRK